MPTHENILTFKIINLKLMKDVWNSSSLKYEILEKNVIQVWCGKHPLSKTFGTHCKGEFFLVPGTNTHQWGINSLKFRRSILWDNLRVNLKEYQYSLEFKLILKQSGSLT